MEVLDLLQWLAIVAVGSLVYRPVGNFLIQNTLFSPVSCYVAAYTLVIVVIKSLISLVKRQVGEKLMSSDVFGRGEYYLGMVGGALRYGCMMIVCMAFLNARYYSPQERLQMARFQENNFGDIRFPTLASMQDTVFQHSVVGQLTQRYLSRCLIAPSAPRRDTFPEIFGHARERQLNEVLESR